MVSNSDSDEELHCHQSSPSDHEKSKKARNRLIIACIFVLIFMIAEVVGGYIANSLAIMTDAAHLLSDFASFLISLFAIFVATRPATKTMSFGYHRAEVIGAVISVLVIWVLTGIFVYLAIERIIHMNFTIDADIMLITASCGVAVNIILGLVLHQSGIPHTHGGHSHSHGHGQHHDEEKLTSSRQNSYQSFGDSHDSQAHGHSHDNINVRAAFIHALGDLVQSVGVLVAAVIIKIKPEWIIADPICTFLFSILVLFTTITILRDAIRILMEGKPGHLDYDKIRTTLENLPGVRMIHDLNIWSLTTDKSALSCHLAVDTETLDNTQRLLALASEKLRRKYSIQQSTIQIELYQPTSMVDCTQCQPPSH